MIRVLVILTVLAYTSEAIADTRLRDEVVPLPNLTERFLGSIGSTFGAQALATMGLDSVDSNSNGQSARRAFVAYGLASRSRFRLGEKLVIDSGFFGTFSEAESDFLYDTSWSRQERRSEVSSDLIGRFSLSDGVSLGGGVNYVYAPKSVDSFSFSDLSAEVISGPAEIFATELIVTKSGSGWSAGFGWREKKKSSRRVTRSSAEEISEMFDDVGFDEQISAGVVTQLRSGHELVLDVRTGASESDFTSLPGSDGKSQLDPQRRYEVLSIYSLDDSGSQRFSVGLGYRTIGYSNQTNVSPQNIPLWTLLLRDKLKFAGAVGQVDAIVGFGEDMQSLPDFNASYRRILVTLQAGVVL
ncbi:MAG: hypothetical protein RJB13_859 [Pseudomonadota bacterium]